MDSALQEAARLDALGEAYVLVTVVQTKPPSSATPGARAVVRPDGQVIGFIGGECTRNVMLEIAGEALGDGKPRRLLLSPEVEMGTSDVVVRRMTCDSGGTVELFLEPRLALSKLVVVGDSPVAGSLISLAESLPWRVRGFKGDVTGDFAHLAKDLQEELDARTFVVIATMGLFDDWAVEAVAGIPVAYVGVVASRRRGELLRLRWLDHQSGADSAVFSAPAGLDLGSRHPGDIALSILAQMTELRQKMGVPSSQRRSPGLDMVIDPVCGMHVDLRKTPYRLELDGMVYGFCAASCREDFMTHPDRYRAG